MLGAGLTLVGQAEEWKSLFDGKTLQGWEGVKKYWSVEDGAITGQSEQPVPYTNFLIYRGGEFADFELVFDYRIYSGNSGVQYRSQEVPAAKSKGKPFRVNGYQADFDPKNEWSGTLYGQGRGIIAKRGTETLMKGGKKPASTKAIGDFNELAKSIKPAGEWNSYKVVAKGNAIEQYINGVLMSKTVDQDPKKFASSGIIALQLHSTKKTGMKVQFKNIKIKELK